MDCLFCKIAAGEIPSKKLYEDETVFAFYDIDPKAPVHFLIVPKAHISSISELDERNSAVVAHIYEVIARLARELGLEKGFRVVANCGGDAGQSVEHLHFHVLAGRLLAWPPG
jgi:histidine triad (HIT) family protein